MSELDESRAAADEKEQLELRKLRADITYTKWSFLAQLLNTATIAVAAIIVLYFFQRPQLDQMELSRLAAEKHQAATLALSALSLQNEADRTRMLKTLEQMYPQQEFIGSVSRSNIILGEKSSTSNLTAQPSAPIQNSNEINAKFCRELNDRWTALKESYLELVNSSMREEAGVVGFGASGKAGRGAAWASIKKQLDRTQAEIDLIEAQLKEKKCW